MPCSWRTPAASPGWPRCSGRRTPRTWRRRRSGRLYQARGRLDGSTERTVAYLNRIVVNEVRSRARRDQTARRSAHLLLVPQSTPDAGGDRQAVIAELTRLRSASGRRSSCGSGSTSAWPTSRTRWASGSARRSPRSHAAGRPGTGPGRRGAVMSIEDRLTRALAAEAETVDVDVEDLRARTRERLSPTASPSARRAGISRAAAAGRGRVRRHRRGRRHVPGDRGRLGPATDPDPGDVDLTFSCSAQRTIDVSGVQDEFLPRLGRGGPAVAEEYDARRWDFVEDGTRATLRSGTTTGRSARSRRTGRWTMAGSRSRRSRADPVRPRSPHRDESAGDARLLAVRAVDVAEYYDGASVLVDDRAVYDYSGLVTRHGPCTSRRAARGSAGRPAARQRWSWRGSARMCPRSRRT